MDNSDRYEFDNPKQVSVATGLTNLKILNILTSEQLNISELAVQLDISVATANYHIKQLEDAGLVASLGEEDESGRDRQRFTAVASRFRLMSSSGSSMSEAEWLRSIASYRRSFEEAVLKWELSVTGDWPRDKRQPKKYGLANIRVSPERYREMFVEVTQLLSRYIAEPDYIGDDAVEGILLCLFFPSKE
jgi:DNA-binding transcriptional ArsR family regulator